MNEMQIRQMQLCAAKEKICCCGERNRLNGFSACNALSRMI